ncbi:peptidylprolyl isomerase [Rubritalea marina]|uniref:peptidylprolyl isomerase n=1 Tax=Rubritalea marina TaxID=361055 RepID=UPI00037584F9|nr:peptidylprolyl isomerase [Rubritalea marina]
MSSKFVVRLGAWSLIMLYLLIDLVIFEGPVKQGVYKMQGHPAAKAANDTKQGIIARVFGKPIYLSQVDYTVDERLWRNGRNRSELSQATRKAMRESALRELCDFAILREKVALNRDSYPVDESELEEAYARFASRFTTPDAFAQALKTMHYKGSQEVKMRLEARIQQNNYLEDKIQPGISVSNEEAKAWYHDHLAELSIPELRHTRHIFISKQHHNATQALRKLEPALDAIIADRSQFQRYNQQLNNDPRAKTRQGSLGALTLQRCLPDIADTIFSMEANTPVIIESTLGWHLIEVTKIEASHQPAFADVKAQIMTTLENTRRKGAVAEYRRNLRLQHSEKIIIHEKLLDADWTGE